MRAIEEELAELDELDIVDVEVETDIYRTEKRRWRGSVSVVLIPDNEIVKKGFTSPLEGFVEKVLYDYGVEEVSAYDVLDMPEVKKYRKIADLASARMRKHLKKVTVSVVAEDAATESRKVYIPKEVK